MPTPPAYGQRDSAAIWKARLRIVARVARFISDLADSFWLVAFGVMVGAIGSLLIWIKWDPSDNHLLIWLIGGCLVGGFGGVGWAKRVFFGKKPATVRALQPPPIPSAEAAERWPGAEERFNRIVARLWVLAFLLMAAFLLLAYAGIADEYEWPVPFSLTPVLFAWGLVGFMGLLFLLMVLAARCPRCRGILWRALELRQCPHCGVRLREL